MKKRPSILLFVSIVCVAALAALPFASRLPSALWNRPAAVPLAKWKTPHGIQQVAWNKDGQILVIQIQEISLERWKFNGQKIPTSVFKSVIALSSDGLTFVQSAHSGILKSIPVTPQNKHLVHDGSKTIDLYHNRRLELIDIANGKCLKTFFWPTDTIQRRIWLPTTFCFSADGSRFACVAQIDGTLDEWGYPFLVLALWETKTGQRLWTKFLRHGDIKLMFSPQNRLLLTNRYLETNPHKAADASGLRLLEAQSGRLILDLGSSNNEFFPSGSTVLSSKGTWLATSTLLFGKDTLKIWNVPKRRLVWSRRDY